MDGSNTTVVIGAGIAGLSCAQALLAGGRRVLVLDKGRAMGGRLATRRTRADPSLIFNHGAQYATARSAGFRALMEATATPWPAAARETTETRWVGVPDMQTIAADLARPIDVSLQAHAAFLHCTGGRWSVRVRDAERSPPGAVTDEGGALHGPFDTVLLAMPAPQAAALLAPTGHRFATEAAAPVIAPCWAVMVAFGARLDAPDTQRLDAGPLGWVARDSARPGRAPLPDCWVLHATPAWSRDNLERPADAVAVDLLAAFAARVGATPRPIHLAAHRWRYALTEKPLGAACLWDASLRIGLCGDWCIGPRVEAGWQSGQALAQAVLAS